MRALAGLATMKNVMDALATLQDDIVRCRACPRLVAWREEVAREKRRAYRDEVYWGRPVPGFGAPAAPLFLLGLAPGAHGANRTGRMFTGDASGDFLYAALFRAGLASQPTSERRGDGLDLRSCFIGAAARCAPPDNAPAPDELARCAGFLDRELDVHRPRAVLALGAIAWASALAAFARAGAAVPRPRAPLRPRRRVVARGRSGAGGELPRLAPEHADRAAHGRDVRRDFAKGHGAGGCVGAWSRLAWAGRSPPAVAISRERLATLSSEREDGSPGELCREARWTRPATPASTRSPTASTASARP